MFPRITYLRGTQLSSLRKTLVSYSVVMLAVGLAAVAGIATPALADKASGLSKAGEKAPQQADCGLARASGGFCLR